MNDILRTEEAGEAHQYGFLENQNKYFIKSEKQQVDVEKVTHRFKYLLGLTGLFHHFIEAKANRDPVFRKIVDELYLKSSGTGAAGSSKLSLIHI